MQSTNWYVFTGAPCSGKTSTIEHLSKLGFKVKFDVVRDYMKEELSSGKTIEELRTDIPKFQKDVLDRRVLAEQTLNSEETMFFDRAIPDSLVYYKIRDFDCTEAIDKAKTNKYKMIFLFERLPMLDDGIRFEDDKRAEKLHIITQEVYTSLGYKLIHVPIMDIDKRANFILSEIENY